MSDWYQRYMTVLGRIEQGNAGASAESTKTNSRPLSAKDASLRNADGTVDRGLRVDLTAPVDAPVGKIGRGTADDTTPRNISSYERPTTQSNVLPFGIPLANPNGGTSNAPAQSGKLTMPNFTANLPTAQFAAQSELNTLKTAYDNAETAYNAASQALERKIQNTPADVDYDQATKAEREALDKAETALRQARTAYEAAGGQGHSYSFEDRASDVVKGFTTSSAAGAVNAVPTFMEYAARPEYQTNYNNYKLALDDAQAEYDAALEKAGGNTEDRAVKRAARALQWAQMDFAPYARATPEEFNEASHELLSPAYNAADKLAETSARDISRAKEGTSDLTKGVIDVSVAAGQMATDAAISAMTGIPANVVMGVRVFGSSAQGARQAGATIDQQVAVGAASATVEVLTEKMFDGVAGIYGKGGADEIVEEVIGRMAKTPAGMNALRVLFSAGGEASEEIISGLTEPLIQSIYNGKSVGQNYSEMEVADILYDGLIGAILGGGTTAVTVNSQANQAKNAEIMANQAGATTSGQADSAWNVLTGRATAEQQAAREARAADQLARGTGMTGSDLVSRYMADQRRATYDNVQAAQAPTTQQAADRAEVRRLTAGRVNESTATQIARTPGLRAAFEVEFGVNLQGMTTEQARRAIQQAASRSNAINQQFQTQQGAAAEAEAARAAEERAAADAQARTALEEEAVRNNSNRYDSYVRGILLNGANTQTANEIINNEEMARAWERLAQKQLPRDKDGNIVRKSAIKMLQQTTRSNVGIDVGNAIDRYVAERTAPPVTQNNVAEEGVVPGSETAQAEEATAVNEAPVELNSGSTQTAPADAPTAVYQPAAPAATEVNPTPAPAPAPAPTQVNGANNTVSQNPAPTTATEQNGDVTEWVPPVNEGATPRAVESQSNSIEGQANAYGLDYEAPNHISKPEAESLATAMNRASSGMNGEMQRLMGKDAWTGEDIDTAMVINGKLIVDAIKNNDFTALDAWNKVLEPHKQEAGRSLQALSKWARGGRAVVEEANRALAESNLPAAEKSATLNKVLQFADRFDMLENGDLDGVRQLILDLNAERGTGSFIRGMYEKWLNKETDFDYLKEYALRQMMAIPNEATTKPDLGQKLKTWQSLAQLMRVTTTLRNVLGNETFGVIDFIPQNTVGTLLDSIVGAVDGTGVRTVGMSSSWLDSDARKAMSKAIDRSMMEIAGDVYMGGENAYGTQGVRTFKMSDGNALSRVLSRAEQLSGYALQATDAAANARQTEAYINMLNRLNGDKLTDAQKAELAKQIADYRLFKNNGLARKVSQGAHDLLNRVGIGGELYANGILRRGGFGGAEILGLNYPGVPANLGVKPLEYSPFNAAKGTVELIKYFADANKTGTHNFAARQNAVMDVARGMTGTALMAGLAKLFLSGVLKNFDDEDDLDVSTQNRAEGKNGTIINLSAADRLLNGGDPTWQNDDRIVNIAYLQPANSLMSISSYIAKAMQEDGKADFGDVVSATGRGSWEGLMDMPVMQSIASLADIIDTKYDPEEGGSKILDAAASVAGNFATGMIPGFLSQTAKATDTVDRDTSGDTVLERTLNQAKSAVPGLRETLPVKYDSLGNPISLGGSAYDRVMNALIRPGTVGNINQSEASSIIGNLIEQTGDSSLMPDRRAPGSVTIKGEKVELSAEDKREWHQSTGKMISDMVTEAAQDPAFQNSSPEVQGQIISAIEAYAKERAKAALAESRGLEYSSDYQTLLTGKGKEGNDGYVPPLSEDNMGQYLAFSTAQNDLEKNGDYAGLQNLYMGFENLDDNTKAVLAAKDPTARLITGVDKDGARYDVPALEPQNLAQYLEFYDGYTNAMRDGDYAAVDNLLAGYMDMDPNTREVIATKDPNGLGSMRYAFDRFGMSSGTYMANKEAVYRAEANLLGDKSGGAADALAINREVHGTDADKLAALEALNQPDKQDGKRAAIVRRFDAATQYGISFDRWCLAEAYIQDHAKSVSSPSNAVLYEAAAAVGVPSWVAKEIWRKTSSDEGAIDVYDNYWSQDYVAPQQPSFTDYYNTGNGMPQETPTTPLDTYGSTPPATGDDWFSRYLASLGKLG